MTVCSKCKIDKPDSSFSFKNKKEGVRKPWCKSCVKVSSASYYQRNKETIIKKTNEYRKNNLDLYADATRRWRDKNPEYYERAKELLYEWKRKNPDRIKAIDARKYAKHRVSDRKRRAVKYEQNKESVKAANKAYKINNRHLYAAYSHNRRARKLASSGKLSPGLSLKLYELQKGMCPCCGKPLGDDFHIDHIVPLSKGGANEDWNIQLLRSSCNLRKNAKDPIEYMQENGFLL